MLRRDLFVGTAAFLAAPGVSVAAEPTSGPTEFLAMQISSGANRPGLRLESDQLQDVLVALHRRLPPNEIETKLGLTADRLADRIQRLIAEGLVRQRPDGGYSPTAMVVTLEDARRYLRPDPALVDRTADRIETRIPSLRAACRSLAGLRNVSFADASLLLLSDVLMDNWQIDGIEAAFLNAPRPLRRGGRYYLAVVEHATSAATDALGFYGNHTEDEGRVSSTSTAIDDTGVRRTSSP